MVDRKDLLSGIKLLGIKKGDSILVRAGLGAIGKLKDKSLFLEALLEAVGPEGTIVSLSFTKSWTILKADSQQFFHDEAPTYAGAFPQSMIDHPESFRSKHPTCSIAAIGKNAKYITDGHDHTSPAYEPIRKLMKLNGKGVLVGCVKSSPGFTTAHLAEYDLGLHRLVILPQLTTTYFKDANGSLQLFRRKDLGLCSQSYSKFYSYYVSEGLLQSSHIGNAYSILVPLREAYEIEYKLLKEKKNFNICENNLCITCNGRRWDRLHKLPAFLLRYLKK